MRLLRNLLFASFMTSGLYSMSYYVLIPAWNDFFWSHHANSLQARLLKTDLPGDTQVVHRLSAIYPASAGSQRCMQFSAVLLRSEQDFAALVNHYTLTAIRLQLSMGKLTHKHFYWNIQGDKSDLNQRIVPAGIRDLAKWVREHPSSRNYVVMYRMQAYRSGFDRRCQ